MQIDLNPKEREYIIEKRENNKKQIRKLDQLSMICSNIAIASSISTTMAYFKGGVPLANYLLVLTAMVGIPTFSAVRNYFSSKRLEKENRLIDYVTQANGQGQGQYDDNLKLATEVGDLLEGYTQEQGGKSR